MTEIGSDELSLICYKYHSDKCPQIKHGYTPFYYELLKDKRDSIKNVLEIGAGDGASLRMWRDFLPNAQIYCGELEDYRIFNEDRIHTFKCDQSQKDSLVSLIEKTGTDIDLFIDDGSHESAHQILTCRVLMPLLKEDVIYIIEDVRVRNHFVELFKEYDCHFEEIHHRNRQDDRLIIVKRK